VIGESRRDEVGRMRRGGRKKGGRSERRLGKKAERGAHNELGSGSGGEL